MEKSQSQQYSTNLFFKGISSDVSPELLENNHGSYLEAHAFGISRTLRNILQVIRGDKSFVAATVPSSDIVFIGGVSFLGYGVMFYRDTVANLTYIYTNNVGPNGTYTLIGQHADYPSGCLDIDTNDETHEMVITDNVTVPIVLNLYSMILAKLASELTYTTDYNFKLYSVNKALQLNQPIFVQLEDLGAAGGLKVGSYAYAACLASKSGESTPWGPVTPYIPVPESGVSLINKGVDSYFSGLKTWGGEPSLIPGRYGIRLRLRIANMSGFNYIKIKRYANNTGQPISYTPTAEFIILTTDSYGGLIDIQTNPYNIIEFTDSNSKDWAILDDSVNQAYSTVKTARTARFYDRRIVLGGVTYESKLLIDKDIFISEYNTNRIAFPVVKTLETGTHIGFSDTYNQVYNKSHRLGERYGFGAKLYDEQGNTLFTVPLKSLEAKDDFTNFQFPNRRDRIPAGVKRVDSIILSGTIGSADILCNGVTKTITFNQKLSQTGRDFIAANYQAYFDSGVVITSNWQTILFTSTVAGVNFSGGTTIITQADGNLTGTAITTQDSTLPTAQVDLVLFQAYAGTGTATIECTTTSGYIQRTISYSGNNIMLGASTFVNAFITNFATIGVTLELYGGGIRLTGLADGSPMTTIATGTLIKTTSIVNTSVTPVTARPRIDKITFSTYPNPVGAVDITCHGITRTMTWDRTLYNTFTTFITDYAADYLPDVVVSLDPFYDNVLIFTGTFTEQTSVVTHSVSNLTGSVDPTIPNIVGDSQIDNIVFDSVSGVTEVQCDVTGGGSYLIGVEETTAPRVVSAFLAYEAINHGFAAIGITISHVVGSAGSLKITGPSEKAVTITVTCASYHITHIQDPSFSTAQIDTLTLSGTIGNALITCGGLARSITFITSLAATAAKFYNDYQYSYSNVGIDVVNNGDTLVFTAQTAGSGFNTIIANLPHTLFGTPVVSQTARIAISQVDVVTLLGDSGTATITCGGLTKSVTFIISLDVTAISFYNSYAALYAAYGITVGYSGATITFTGPASGSTITTTATGTLVDGIYTSTPNSYGVAQIDKVTITGSTGNAIITCNGIPRGVSYITSPTQTASQFVTQYAADYAPSIGVTSSGADIFFTKLLGLEVAFSGTTTIVHSVSDLSGSPSTIRANASGGGELNASTGKFQDSTVDSWSGVDVDYVYDPVNAKRLFKQSNNKELNIISVADPSGGLVKPYSPITPTGRGNSLNENTYDDITQMNIMNTVDTVDDCVGQYGSNVSTIGLRIGGIDITKLPSTVKSFSIVRTPAAGRVVCQGIGMYSLIEKAYNATNPSLSKNLNKIWFYSPEIDSVIGNKGGVYEDIKANPEDYQIQLVTPCGFFSDFYSSYNYASDALLAQDFVSMPICGAGADARPMFPPDSAGTNYISFGKWRNTSQGTGLAAGLTFNLASPYAVDVPHGKIRVPYLELTLDANIYYSADVKSEASSTAQSKAFHEPWYIINIIQNKQVPDNNVNSYNDIGHSIRLESIIGLSSGEATQTFSLVEERREDVYGLGETASTYRYIWVDGKPWVDSNNIASVAAYLTALEGGGSFTPSGGLECYGIYTLTSDSIITFTKVLPSSLVPVVPAKGSQIVVKYNNNSPIEVFLGDTYIAGASFLAIDTLEGASNEFVLHAPMPHYNFTLKTNYHQAKDSELASAHADIWDDQGSHRVGQIRQWLVYFMCESTVNIPLAYKNFFPNRLYAMRPTEHTLKLDTETIDEYFIRMRIYPQYNDDYPDEYLNWSYGGLSTPASVNFDYEKILPLKSYAEPQSGANEFLYLMKRLHWSTERIPGFESNRVFVPTNIYDLKNDKASQISILYDQYSERGSNLYVITDRGAGMLLTNKQMITTAEGNSLTILANDASFIKGEVWLNNSIGCPKEFWRAKSEGAVKLPNNIVASILVFPSQDDIVMLTNNNFIQIADNNRAAILASLEAIDINNPFETKIYSVIDQGENKLRMTLGDVTYVFNFDINNWDGSVKSLVYDKSFNSKTLVGADDRNVLIHAVNTDFFGLAISQKVPVRLTDIGDVPYVIFSVTPGLGEAYRFIDMFISCYSMLWDRGGWQEKSYHWLLAGIRKEMRRLA